MTVQHLLLLLDWRAHDDIVFHAVRQSVLNQMINFLRIVSFQRASASFERSDKAISALAVSVKVVYQKTVVCVLHRVVYLRPVGEGQAAAPSEVLDTLRALRTRPPEPYISGKGGDSSVAARLRPLCDAVFDLTHASNPSAGPTLSRGFSDHVDPSTGTEEEERVCVLVITTFLNFKDIFAWLGWLEKAVRGPSAAPPCGPAGKLEVHCLSADVEAVSVTMGDFEEGVEKADPFQKKRNAWRLYRSSYNPEDIAYSLQTALCPFLLGITPMPTLLVLSHDLSLQCSCVSSMLGDFGSSDDETTRWTRHKRILRQSHHEGRTASAAEAVPSAPVALKLEAVLSPQMVQETALCGTPWVLTPVASIAVEWQHLHSQFGADVLLLSSEDPPFHAQHAFRGQRTQYVGFFQDRAHFVLRKVTSSSRRRCFVSLNAKTSTQPINAALQAKMERIRNENLKRQRDELNSQDSFTEESKLFPLK